ncbi:hypothetical protein P3L10_009472 [Capsicum annuum]
MNQRIGILIGEKLVILGRGPTKEKRKIDDRETLASFCYFSLEDLKTYITVDSFHDLGFDKDVIVEKIEGKADSGDAVSTSSDQQNLNSYISNMRMTYLTRFHFLERFGPINSAEIRTHKLSSMFSTYLGEDQILVVACKSRAASSVVENYQMDGNVNCASALDILAVKHGSSIKGRYLVICLEDIRPYMPVVINDPQRELAFPHPTFSNGETPPGFLGCAVNGTPSCRTSAV